MGFADVPAEVAQVVVAAVVVGDRRGGEQPSGFRAADYFERWRRRCGGVYRDGDGGRGCGGDRCRVC